LLFGKLFIILLLHEDEPLRQDALEKGVIVKHDFLFEFLFFIDTEFALNRLLG